MPSQIIGRVQPVNQGNYDATRAYVVLDRVKFQGAWYECQADAAAGVAPETGGNAYWMEIGAKGDAGQSPQPVWDGTKLHFEYSDGASTQAVDLQGPQGIQGEQGRDGQTPPLTSDLTSTAPDVALSALGGNKLYQAANANRRNIGELVRSLVPLDDAGLHLLDGTLLAADGMYAAGIAKIVALQTDHPGLFVTEADWQASVAAYGVCGKFVYDATAGTLRLPKVTGFLEATVDAAALGDLVEAGLPNITGSANNVRYSYNSLGISTNGAFTFDHNTIDDKGMGSSGKTTGPLTFKASQSNLIYGNSTTVQPQSIKGFVYMVLANTVKAPVVVDAEQYANDVNALAGDVATRTTAAGAAHAAMPSGQGIELTLPAAKGTFIAPDDGYLHFSKIATAARQYIELFVVEDNTYFTVQERPTSFADQSIWLVAWIPVRKGCTVYVDYTAAGNTGTFSFIYANGSIPA